MASSQEFLYSTLPSGHIRLLVLHPATTFDDPVSVSIKNHDFARSKQIFDRDTDYWNVKRDFELAKCDLKEQNATGAGKVVGEDGIPTGPVWNVQEQYDEESKRLERLIKHRRMLPAQNDSFLETETTTDPLLYEAVSYAWGEQEETGQIAEISGSVIRSLHVRCNVVEMLRYLRRRSAPRHLWIDALCINQANNEERSVQVRVMGDIYSQASRVLVWIGSPHPTHPVLYVPESELRDPAASQAFREVFCRRWFKRRWVTQEVVLARRALFVCGHRSREFDDFVDRIQQTIDSWEETNLTATVLTREEAEVIKTLHVLAYMHKDNTQGLLNKESMFMLLNLFSGLACSERHDIFYALNSLCNAPVEVDYNRSFESICLKFTESELSRYPFRLLSYAAGCPSDTPLSPSWIPDYTRPYNRCFLEGSFDDPPIFASYEKFITVSGEALSIKVKCIGRIHEVKASEDYFATGDHIASAFKFRQRDLEECNNFFKTHRRIVEEHPLHGFDPLLVNTLTNREWVPRELEDTPMELRRKYQIESLSDSTGATMIGRTCFFTDNGHFGLGPRNIQTGDVLVCMPGSQILLALHPVNGEVHESRKQDNFETTATVVGDCYVPELLVDEVLPTDGDLVTYKII